VRLDEIETIVAAGRATAHQVGAVLAEISRALETSAATRLLSGIDVCNAQVVVSIVGIFSMYESRLQTAYGWNKPFDEVISALIASHRSSEADLFDDYRLAVNVLKHGVGSSHEKLLARGSRLPFEVQKDFGDLHEEGDVCPPSDLVVVSVKHLEQCCDLIEASWNVVRAVPARLPSA
jgi:hypothetical protein